MTNLAPTIIPKSDQLNSDELIAGPMTITITDVTVSKDPQQPVVLHYEGENGHPFKPCKSMRRVLINAWGSDGNQYKGKSMRLYRDASVKFGGDAVGGVRISHMSDINGRMELFLTETRGKKKPFVVDPFPKSPVKMLSEDYVSCADAAGFERLEAQRKVLWAKLSVDDRKSMKTLVDATKARIEASVSTEPAATTQSTEEKPFDISDLDSMSDLEAYSNDLLSSGKMTPEIKAAIEARAAQIAP